MRALLTLIVSVFFVFNSALTHAALFSSDYGAVQATSSNCDDCVDGPVSFAAGHSLRFFGKTYTGLYVGSNGFVTFGAASTSYSPAPLDTQTIGPMIAGLFTDLDSGNDTASKVYVNTGTPGQLVVTWEKMGHYDENYSVRSTFQLVIRSDQYMTSHSGGQQIGFFWGDISDGRDAAAGFGDGLSAVNAGEQAIFFAPAKQLSNHAERWFSASGATATGAEISKVYPDSNPDEAWTTYKHHGDLLRVVVRLNGSTESASPGTLRLDLAQTGLTGVDASWPARVYKRKNLRAMATEPYNGSVVVNTNPGSTATRLEVEYSLTAGETAEYVFVVKLQEKASNATNPIGFINATASIVGGVSVKPMAGRVFVSGNKRIMLVNEYAMYRVLSRNDQGALETVRTLRLDYFMKTLYKVAAEAKAVVIPVDLYDFVDDHPAVNPTHTWVEDRKALPYGTGYADAEAAVNTAALRVDEILQEAITRSGGVGTNGRHVAIIGDDRIIPHYRLSDPSSSGQCSRADGVTRKLRCDSDSYGDVSSVIGSDAFKGYMYSDLRYRSTVPSGASSIADWTERNIYLGRIVGHTSTVMGQFLVSSNSPHTRIGRVLKLENDERNGRLADWESDAIEDSYSILKSANGHDTDNNCGVDDDPVHGACYEKGWLYDTGGYDDPATRTDFNTFFSGGTTFDIYRGMTHGGNSAGIDGVFSSNPPGNSHDYFSGTTLGNVSFTNRSFQPFFILDACLIGLSARSTNSFMNGLAGTGIRGALASTVITFSGDGNDGDISKYNDIFYRWSRDSTAGKALNRASRALKSLSASSTGDTLMYARFHRAAMNLFGLPWAEVAQSAPANARLARSAASPASLVPKTALNESLGTVNVRQINVDGEQAALLSVAGFSENRSSPLEPVLPVKNYEFSLPADAVVAGVNVQFAQNESLGALRLPGFKLGVALLPPRGVPDRFVLLPSGTGLFPTEKFRYTVANLGDRVVVNVRVMPFTYDRATRMVTAYKQFSVDVNYTTASGVVFNGASTDKGQFHSGEAMPVAVALSSTQSASAPVAIEYSLLDADENTVASGTENVTLSGYEEGLRVLNLVAPTLAGPATLTVRVIRNGISLGSTERIVQVANVALEKVTVPAFASPGGALSVSAEVVNRGTTSASGTVNFSVFRDGQEIGQFTPQAVSSLASGSRATVSSTWTPAQDLAGSYLTVAATVTMNGSSITAIPVAVYVGVFHNLSGVANPSAGGSVSCASPVPTGEMGHCTVSANSGYLLNGVSSTCGGAIEGSVFTTAALTADCTVSATFVSNTFSLTVTKSGIGNGTVSSDPAGITCGTDCTENYISGQSVTLTASPVAGSSFAGWSGACSGTAPSCPLTMSQARSVTASFNGALVSQSITFGSAPSVKVGATGTVSARASSGLEVTLSSATPSICSVFKSGLSEIGVLGTVTGVAVGTCTIAANQAGNSSFSAAAQVTQSVTVSASVLASQTITFGAAPTVKVGSTGSISARASSGLEVALSSATPSICSVVKSGLSEIGVLGTVTGITAGICTLAANQAGNGSFSAAPQATQTIVVSATTSIGGRYSKIANNGVALPDSAVLGSGASDWACTRDKSTGLTWEVKTADGGLRDLNKGYTNYDDPTQAQKWNGGSVFVNPTQAEIDAASNSIGLVNAVNGAALCGFSDWKRPSKDELFALVEPSHRPTINLTFFPNTPSSYFWSGSPVADYSGNALSVGFGDGYVVGPYRNNDGQVRLVRGGLSLNLLQNPGFESGVTGWTQFSSAGNLLIHYYSSQAHSGASMAALGNNSTTDFIEQSVTIPANATKATVEFWYAIGTAETSTIDAYDTLAVELYTGDGGLLPPAKLATLTTLSNLDKSNEWVKKSVAFNVSAYRGQAVRLRFTAKNDSLTNNSLTLFSIDDVGLTTKASPSLTPILILLLD